MTKARELYGIYKPEFWVVIIMALVGALWLSTKSDIATAQTEAKAATEKAATAETDHKMFKVEMQQAMMTMKKSVSSIEKNTEKMTELSALLLRQNTEQGKDIEFQADHLKRIDKEIERLRADAHKPGDTSPGH